MGFELLGSPVNAILRVLLNQQNASVQDTPAILIASTPGVLVVVGQFAVAAL